VIIFLKDSACAYSNVSSNIGGTLIKWTKVTNETNLQYAVANIGPITVAVNASDFQFYGGGIYNAASCEKPVDHGMVVVGYGTLDGQDYWIVKNSWGTSWGLDGYMLLARNAGNKCAVASYSYYPVV